MEEGGDGICERLRLLTRGRTAREVAVATGFEINVVRRTLSGHRRAGLDFVVSVCRAYGASAEWLLRGTGAPFLEDVTLGAIREAAPARAMAAVAEQMEELRRRVERMERRMRSMDGFEGDARRLDLTRLEEFEGEE